MQVHQPVSHHQEPVPVNTSHDRQPDNTACTCNIVQDMTGLAIAVVASHSPSSRTCFMQLQAHQQTMLCSGAHPAHLQLMDMA